MTKIEWLEHVEENLHFPASGVGQNAAHLLYATPEECHSLKLAHERYCAEVEKILFPDGR